MGKIIKSKLFWAVFAVLLVLGLILFLPEKPKEYETIRADYDSIKESVSVTGTVESNAIINLAFRSNGKVDKVLVEVGDKVKAGKNLMQLEQDLAKIDVQKAKAGLDLAKAELNLINAGSTKEEVKIAEAQLKEAEVNLANAQKTLEDTILSNTEALEKAEIEVQNATLLLSDSQSSLDNNQASNQNQTELSQKRLENAYKNAEIQIKSAYNDINQSYLAADEILGIDDQTANDAFDDLLGARSFSNLNNANNKYKALKPKISAFNQSYNTILSQSFPPEELETFLLETQTLVVEVKSLLDQVYQVLEDTLPSQDFSQTQIDLEKDAIQAYRISLITQAQSLQTDQQAIIDAKLSLSGTTISSDGSSTTAQTNLSTSQNTLALAEKSLEQVKIQNQISQNNAQMQIDLAQAKLDQATASLNQVKAKPRAVDLAAAKARISQSQAQVQEAEIIADYGILRSPSAGVITQVLSEPGESIAIGQETVRMITDEMSIVANVSETDIDKIFLNAPVSLNFDAFDPDLTFEGQVISIDPAETVVDGVINYQIHIIFENPEKKTIKSGMTANIDIFTQEKEEVITVPAEAVQFEGDETFINLLKAGQSQRRKITIGIEGENKIEVTAGLNPGEKVILYELD